MDNTIIPKNYKSVLDYRDTQISIKMIKDYFQSRLAERLNLIRVSAPLFVTEDSGLNDNLNGYERPIDFSINGTNSKVQIIHSLAKWKRYALERYGFTYGEGIYTDMNAIRRDEITDNIHSVYVDQWDWEKVIKKEDRNIDTLKNTVNIIYGVLKDTAQYLSDHYEYIQNILPEEIFFITSQDLEDMYPNLSPKQREYKIAKQKGAVFIMQIGSILASGQKHDGRAPDYDDWSLNGDIILYYPLLDIALEISSMGIRVDADTLKQQLSSANYQERIHMPFHNSVLDSLLPYTIGGGIGQSRICMFFLNKAHIGEVQVSIWPEKAELMAREYGISLL